MNQTENIFDITILGGGPTGLFAAFYSGLRNASCKILDSMPALGGRLTAVYPEKYIYDVAGFPKVLAKDLVDNLVAQAMAYKPVLALEEVAQTLNRRDDGVWELTTQSGQLHLTRTLIVAAGVGSYSPKKHMAPGAPAFEGKGICYAVLNKEVHRNRKVVVIGGGDSALDWANEMVPLASEVTLIHRSDRFRAHDDSVNKLKATSARILTNTEVIAFEGDSVLKRIVIENTETKEQSSIDVDDALVMFGFNSSLGKIREWGIELTGDGIKVNECMETNLPGIYAAGDIAEYRGKLKLIATGFSEAAIAVNFAKTFINPKEKAQPLHSTTIMELKEKRGARAAAKSNS
ncbi:MAG: NAD(P)/FAD-dependent oxidoreductase [Betaproteobacteria bacterium]|nr:NAD(P)/FAD-dependent oxidoreductase [Betaproteobacteria bacterium]